MEKPTKRARVITAAVAVLVILAVGIVTFYKVPAFHALLHPHPVGDNAANTAEQVHLRHAPVHPLRQAGQLPHLRDDVDKGRERPGSRRRGRRSVGARDETFGRRAEDPLLS